MPSGGGSSRDTTRPDANASPKGRIDATARTVNAKHRFGAHAPVTSAPSAITAHRHDPRWVEPTVIKKSATISVATDAALDAALNA
jgi:hypothetical protein